MMLIAGTVPVQAIPLLTGKADILRDKLAVDGKYIPCMQGTSAMICAALTATEYLGLESPQIVIAGDIGDGRGSREIYEYLIENIVELSPEVLVLHYWLPDMSLSRRLCEAVKKCEKKPLMIADAGSMYSAKAAGLSGEFDIFTPDATEIAFLADINATHPAYIARHFFDTDITFTPRLVAAAHAYKSSAKFLLVKGEVDYIAKDGKILSIITEPRVPALEAIGGTGDTITGLLSAFAYAGLEPQEASIIAARANRTAGEYAKATPATKVKEIITVFPSVFKDNLCKWSTIHPKEK